MDDYNAMEEQLELHIRHLRELQKQAAVYGIDVSPHVALRIKDLQKRIAEIENDRSEIDGSRIYTPGNIDCVTHIWTYRHKTNAHENYSGIADRFKADFTCYYDQSDAQQVPTEQQWKTAILPKLKDIADTMCDDDEVKAYLEAKQTVGIAFGAQFAGSGKVIWVTPTRQQGQRVFWNSNAPEARVYLPEPISKGQNDGSDLVLEVCASSEYESRVQVPVTAAIQEYNIAVKKRITIGYGSPDKVLGPGHAAAIARIIGEQIRRSGAKTVHFFGTVPIPLAVFIGMQLNACPKIQLYEHVKKDTGGTPYVPACLL